MKNFVKSLVYRVLKKLAVPLNKEVMSPFQLPGEASSAASKVSQRALLLEYRRLLAQKEPLPNLSDIGFRVYSQCDEDGILLYLFSLIGTTNKMFVEIGAGSNGDNVECNAANFAINWGWHGLFIDGDESNVAHGKDFYGRHPDTHIFPPQFLQAMVNRDSINEIISSAGFNGEIDFFSIDIDGMDYWVWEAIDCISPRLVQVEANGKFGERSITVPYNENWEYDANAHPHYHGASLAAFTKLAEKKGYRLVGVNRFGFNAFFVRNDIATDLLPVVSIESCRKHPTRENDEKIFARISELPFVKV